MAKKNVVPKFEDVKHLVFKLPSKKNLERMMRQVSTIQNKREELENEKYKPKEVYKGPCHCGGKIILKITYTSEIRSNAGPLIIGPGSRSQFYKKEHSTCSCNKCGALYDPSLVKP